MDIQRTNKKYKAKWFLKYHIFLHNYKEKMGNILQIKDYLHKILKELLWDAFDFDELLL
jgi:hypothetical protein